MSSGNEEAQLAQCQAYVRSHNIQQLVKDAIINEQRVQEASHNAEQALEDDDTLDEPPPMPQGGGRRRLGVSAEVPDENEAANYKRVIIPKDDNAKQSLRNAMCKNLLFAHLDADEQKAIFDAMFQWRRKGRNHH
uniref:Uncharacterized protein n=1 Tax=Ditylenchus dipsaci TaxID=166011 RepID=A0A915EPT1_9BILA